MKNLNKVKKYIVNVSLLFIIFVIACVPIFLSNMQKQNILGKLNTENLEIKKSNTEETSKKVEDKLTLIANYKRKDKNIVLIEKSDNDIKNSNILPIVVNELKKLQDIGVFPKVNLDNNLSVYEYSLRTYMDKNSPQNFVTTLDVDLSSPEYDIYICMDSKTQKIYEFSMSSNSLMKINFNIEIENSLENYLGVKWEKTGYEIENYNELLYLRNGEIVYSYYGNKQIVCLNLFPKSMYIK